jgi:hypothetical protein
VVLAAMAHTWGGQAATHYSPFLHESSISLQAGHGTATLWQNSWTLEMPWWAP